MQIFLSQFYMMLMMQMHLLQAWDVTLRFADKWRPILDLEEVEFQGARR
jgi:hypothetical protein